MLRTPATPDTTADSSSDAPSPGLDPHTASPLPPPQDAGQQLWRQRFPRAVWQLHTTIFGSYRLWLDNVGLAHGRSQHCEEQMRAWGWGDARTLNALLSELGLYFLVGVGECGGAAMVAVV